jgi:hypothetical protein
VLNLTIRLAVGEAPDAQDGVVAVEVKPVATLFAVRLVPVD